MSRRGCGFGSSWRGLGRRWRGPPVFGGWRRRERPPARGRSSAYVHRARLAVEILGDAVVLIQQRRQVRILGGQLSAGGDAEERITDRVHDARRPLVGDGVAEQLVARGVVLRGGRYLRDIQERDRVVPRIVE